MRLRATIRFTDYSLDTRCTERVESDFGDFSPERYDHIRDELIEKLSLAWNYMRDRYRQPATTE